MMITQYIVRRDNRVCNEYGRFRTEAELIEYMAKVSVDYDILKIRSKAKRIPLGTWKGMGDSPLFINTVEPLYEIVDTIIVSTTRGL